MRLTSATAKLAAVLATVALVALACGPAAQPTATPTQPAQPTPTATRAAPAPAPTATAAPATPTPTVARPTPAAVATPTPVPPTPAPGVEPGVFSVDVSKLQGIKFLANPPDYSKKPQRGGVLKTALNYVWPHFDASQTSGAGLLYAITPVYNTIVRCKGGAEMKAYNPWDCEIGDSLAQSWQASADGKVWTFQLRQGVKFHNLPPVNGREMTSEDVKFSFEYYKAGPGQGSRFVNFERIEAPDKYTVRIVLKEPYADFLAATIGERHIGILPKEIKDKDGDFRKTLVGTGPMMVKEILGKERIVYTRNPDFWRKGQPFLDGYEVNVILDFQTQRSAYRAGLIHRPFDDLDPAEVPSLLRSVPNTVVYTWSQRYSQYALYVRLDKAPYSDVRVRKAISLAVDRPGILKDIYKGYGVITGPVPWYPIFDKSPTLDQMPNYKYDPEQAKKLLAEAGHPGGIDLELIYYPYPLLANQINIVLDSLNKAGIRAKLKPMENIAFNAAVRRPGGYDQGAAGLAWTHSSIDGYLYENMHSGSIFNFGQITIPELDKLLEAQRVEVDPVKRQAMMQKVWQMEHDNVWRIPLVRQDQIQYFTGKYHNELYNDTMIPPFSTGQMLEFFWLEQ